MRRGTLLIVGVGIDLVEVSRIAGAAERHGDRFLRRIFTRLEVEGIHGGRERYLAARFAAKEAALKALGTGLRGGVRWVDVEVDNLASGRPVLRLYGRALELAERMGATLYHVSISHTAEHALAQVVLEGREAEPQALPGSRPEMNGWYQTADRPKGGEEEQ